MIQGSEKVLCAGSSACAGPEQASCLLAEKCVISQGDVNVFLPLAKLLEHGIKIKTLKVAVTKLLKCGIKSKTPR